MADRRSFLRNGFLGLGALSLGSLPFAANATSSDIIQPKTRSLRIAHLTDCHTQPNTKTEKALKSVFRQINNMQDRPDMIINTGDSVLEANYATAGFLNDCWDVWNDSIGCCSIPMFSCIGNHDIWTIHDIEESLQTTEGKLSCMQKLGLKQPYYTFERDGWKFIALDSISDDGYKLDDKQWHWLESELSNTTKPICVYSHVPIISAASMMYAMERRSGDSVIQKEMHADAKGLKDMFFKYKNVKLCLSGHVHYIDEVDYLGVKYMCNGSISGNWWKGKLDEFPPAYAIIDLFSDGSVKKELVYY